MLAHLQNSVSVLDKNNQYHFFDFNLYQDLRLMLMTYDCKPLVSAKYGLKGHSAVSPGHRPGFVMQ